MCVIAHLMPCQFNHETGACYEGSYDYEIGQGPVPFITDLHRYQGNQQYTCCHERNTINAVLHNTFCFWMFLSTTSVS